MGGNIKGKIVLSPLDIMKKIAQSPLDRVDRIILSSLDIVDKRKCHCRTEWQHRAELVRLVNNLNSCSWQEIRKD